MADNSLFPIASVAPSHSEGVSEDGKHPIPAHLDWLASVVETSTDAIISKDLDGVILTWNAAAERLYGYRAEEVIGENITILAPPGRTAEIEELTNRLRQGESFSAFETQRRRKDGVIIDVSLSISHMRDAAGRPAGSVLIIRDITREKTAERALEAGEQRLRLALEAAQAGAWEADEETDAFAASGRALQLHGLTPDVTLTNDHAAAAIMPEERAAVQAALAHSIATGERFYSEHRVRHPDGTVHWVASYAQRLGGAHQSRVVGLVQDIDARKQREEERDAFIAALSHDLKGPLAAVLGTAELLERQFAQSRPVSSDDLLVHLARIRTAGRRAVSLLDELLDVARIQGGHPLILQTERCDLVAITREVVSTQQALTARHTLSLHTSTQELWGMWDCPRLERVVTNLLSNAVKYSPEGGDVAIDLAPDSSGGQAILTVTDHGVGIPADDVPNLFRSFRRAGNVAKHIPGSGIGLLSVAQIVAAHGGTISVTSEEGMGSTFVVRLPIRPPSPTPANSGDHQYVYGAR